MSNAGNDKTRIKKVCIKSYCLKELADFYDVSVFRLRKRMKPHMAEIGEHEEGTYDYDEKQVALIFQLIPLPSNVRLIQV